MEGKGVDRDLRGNADARGKERTIRDEEASHLMMLAF
jgi:hypothetical protein